MSHFEHQSEALRVSWPPSAALRVSACSRKPYHRVAVVTPAIFSVVWAVGEASIRLLHSAGNGRGGWNVGAKGERKNQSREITQALQAATSLKLTSSVVTEGTERPSSPVISVVFGICLFVGVFGVWFFFFTKSIFVPSSYLWSWCIDRESSNPWTTPRLRNATLTVTNQ